MRGAREEITKRKGTKVKDENVSYLLLEPASLIYLVSSHTSALALSLSLFSYPLRLPCSPPMSLPYNPCSSLPLTLRFPFVTLVSISHYFSLSLFHTLQSFTSKKTSHAQFGLQPVKHRFEYTRAPADTPITLAYSQGNNRIKE